MFITKHHRYNKNCNDASQISTLTGPEFSNTSSFTVEPRNLLMPEIELAGFFIMCCLAASPTNC